MATSLTGSVGKNGVNRDADVRTVQTLLNQNGQKFNLSRPLVVDGRVGPLTIGAIESFQAKVVGMRLPDGRVDPGGKTLAALHGSGGGSPAPAASTTGRVTGKTAGVNAGIIKYLEAVAQHYGLEVHVTSGKRNPTEQASAMWGGWGQHLERGNVYIYLRNNPTIRQELDGYYNQAHAAGASAAVKAAAQQAFTNKVVSIAGSLSRHLTGEAVDVTVRTDKRVLDALAVGFQHVIEKYQGTIRCHHFDTRKFGKAPDVTPELKAQWPKA